MELLKQKIQSNSTVIGSEIVKVDSFLNHQLDISFLNEIGQEFYKRFSGLDITKILTIEASGIAIAAITSQYFDNIPVVFAKKTESRNLDIETFHSEVFSFTKQKSYPILVSKKYLSAEDRILIIDDFLANGKAVMALSDIVSQSGATLVGTGIVIEKGFQPGGSMLRSTGMKVESLVIIKGIEQGKVIFTE